MSEQTQAAFVHFLQPIADLGLRVTAVLSDKQSGLLPAVADVFPQAKHAFCQIHYLRNIAIPLAEADEAMKVRLRQGIRESLGEWIRQEKDEQQGVLTVNGLLPSPVELQSATLQATTAEAAQWLKKIADLLELAGQPSRSGEQIRQALLALLDEIQETRHADPFLRQVCDHIQKKPHAVMRPVCSIVMMYLDCLVQTMSAKANSAISINAYCTPLDRKRSPVASFNVKGPGN